MLPPLYPHQSAAATKALSRNGSLALFHEPGLGKTRTCLEIFLRLRADQPTLKLLVVCPLSLVEAAWRTDVEKFTTLTWCALKRYDRTAEVFVINYEALIRPTGQRLLHKSGLLASPLMLVIDESSRIRDPRSQTTKAILALAEWCQYRYVLSGTPTPNGLHELWAQLKVIDPNSVHRSFYAWRRTYFYLGRNGRAIEPPPSRQAMQQLFQQGYTWRITNENRDRLLAHAAPICHWVRKATALPDLPERITTIRHVTLSPAEHAAYEQMRRQLVVEFQNEVVSAPIAITKLQKLQQIANGWVYGEETAHQIGTSRLNVLLETLDELGEQPVIIWALYQESIRQIAAALGDRAVTLYGETKDRLESLRRFGNDAQYLIAHPLSAGHGLTLTQSSANIWYSLPYSLEQYLQANDRTHRIGMTRAVLYIHLIAPETIDEDIYAVLEKKKTLQEIINAYLGSRPPSRCVAADQTMLADRVGAGRAA